MNFGPRCSLSILYWYDIDYSVDIFQIEICPPVHFIKIIEYDHENARKGSKIWCECWKEGAIRCCTANRWSKSCFVNSWTHLQTSTPRHPILCTHDRKIWRGLWGGFSSNYFPISSKNHFHDPFLVVVYVLSYLLSKFITNCLPSNWLNLHYWMARNAVMVVSGNGKGPRQYFPWLSKRNSAKNKNFQGKSTIWNIFETKSRK